VLCSDYGLMGEMVRRHELGLTVDSTRPEEIAGVLTQFLQISDPADLCNPKTMINFVKQNSAKEFARVIFDQV
jgi:hypothetical protein